MSDYYERLAKEYEKHLRLIFESACDTGDRGLRLSTIKHFSNPYQISNIRKRVRNEVGESNEQ